MKKILVIFFVLIFVSSVYAACTYSERGVHGISIEGICYDCGEDDGICPSNFKDVVCDKVDCDCDTDKSKPECTGAVAECTVCTDCDTFLGLGCDQEECAKCGDCYYLGLISGCEDCSTLTCEEIAVADCGTKCTDLNCEVVNGECVEETGAGNCGNGQLDEGELCDGTEILNDATCDDFGLSGNIICTDTCEFDETSCGGLSCDNDNNLDDGEMCDGDNFISNYDSCEKLGYVSGTLSCTDCIIDDSGCSMEAEDPCSTLPDFPQLCVNIGDPTQYICIEIDASCDDVDWGSGDVIPCTIDNCGTETAPPGCDDCSIFSGEGVVTGYEEPSQPFPIFTWFNLIITSVIIIGFYIFYRRK